MCVPIHVPIDVYSHCPECVPTLQSIFGILKFKSRENIIKGLYCLLGIQIIYQTFKSSCITSQSVVQPSANVHLPIA